MEWYLASVEEWETADFFLDFQEIDELSKKMQ